jgi:hypothetical protein
MPAKSEKQKQFMDAAAHNPAFAKAAGVPVSVAKEFSGASKGMKFGKDTNKSRPDLQKINNPSTRQGKMELMRKGGGTMATKKMNMGGYADGGLNMVRKGDKMVPDYAADGVGKMKKGGMAHEDVKMDKKMMQKAVNKHEGRLHKGAAMTKLKTGGMAPSKMGAVKTGKTPNGVASKGKTKGKMIKMNMGGRSC